MNREGRVSIYMNIIGDGTGEYSSSSICWLKLQKFTLLVPLNASLYEEYNSSWRAPPTAHCTVL
jgi:hypothetical protein